MMSASVSLPDLMRAPPSRAAFARSALVACSLRILRGGRVSGDTAKRGAKDSPILDGVVDRDLEDLDVLELAHTVHAPEGL